MVADTLRLFFSLWPADEVRQQIVAASKQTLAAAGGRRIPAENYHITLAFLGSVPRDRVHELIKAARNIYFPAFEIQLDRHGCWPRSQVVWLEPSVTPSPMEKLAMDLWAELEPLGFVRQERSFRPHVSLVRRASAEADKLIDPVVWPVSDFVLVQSDTRPSGSVYSLLEHFPADP